MHKIVVRLPENRDYAGQLTIESPGGKRIAGPFEVCGRADDELARHNKNSARNPLLPFGDTPLGSYRAVQIMPSGPGTPYRSGEFGSAGIVLLQPRHGEAALADANGRFGFFIHGGTLARNGALRPTEGSLRLSNRDQKKFIAALRRLGETCECVVTKLRGGKRGRTIAIISPQPAQTPSRAARASSVPLETTRRSWLRLMLLAGASASVPSLLLFSPEAAVAEGGGDYQQPTPEPNPTPSPPEPNPEPMPEPNPEPQPSEPNPEPSPEPNPAPPEPNPEPNPEPPPQPTPEPAPTPAPNPPPAPTDADLRDAPNSPPNPNPAPNQLTPFPQQNTPTTGQTPAAQNPPPGNDTKAADQLKSISQTTPSPENNGQGIDTGGTYAGHIDSSHVVAPSSGTASTDNLNIPPSMANDPDVQNLQKYQQQMKQDQEAAARAQADYEKEKLVNPNANMAAVLDAQAKLKGAQDMVKFETGQVKAKLPALPTAPPAPPPKSP